LANGELKINGQIKSREVKLVSSDGEMMGVVPLAKALIAARSENLDLVEVSPNVDPPVCKIADYGKIRYQNQKKATETKKKQKIVGIKEIKLSINIAQGDYDTKMKQAGKFFEQGNSVKFSFQFRGREIVHSNIAREMANKIIDQFDDRAKVTMAPQMEGKKLLFILAPSLKKS
jgi:translation initiation factor IF-3